MFKIRKLLAMGLVIASMTFTMVTPALAAKFASIEVCKAKFEAEIAGVQQGTTTEAKETYNKLWSAWSSGTQEVFKGLDKSAANMSKDKDISWKGVTRYYPDQETMEADYDTFVAMSATISTANAGISSGSDAANTLKNSIASMNPSADVTGATRSLNGFNSLISLTTGTIVVAVTMLMALFTAFDVAYLVFPIAKDNLDKAGNSGNRMTSTTNKTTGESKFRFVTDDAQNAYQDASQTGQNPLFIYAKKRLISYIALAFILFIFMTGRLGLIMEAALKIFSNVFDALMTASGV